MRKSYDSKFKSKVALEAIKGEYIDTESNQLAFIVYLCYIIPQKE
jgi:hypothetical protein